ncbi:extracellular solute-binding protein [Anaerosporobacter sp.]
MRRNLGEKLTAIVLVTCMTAVMLSGCGSNSNKKNSKQTQADGSQEGGDSTEDAWKLAETTPDAPYPETVEYTVGATVVSGTKFPEGSNDTTTDNGYTRLYKEKINIQNTNKFEATDGEDYNQKVSMAMASGDLPDIMHVDDYATFKELVENDLIAELTDAYNNCASDLMKEIYESNDNKALDMATIDGKLYAIPTTTISGGPELLWLRGDWMDKLGLSEPQSIDDITNILRQFVEKDPGGNGAGKTIGLAVMPSWNTNFMYSSYAGSYQVNNIFTMNGAIPRQWITGSDGSAVYGSVQPEMKKGLEILANWYKEGLIDQQMPVRTEDDLKALVGNGQCGAFFAGWWAPYHTVSSYTLNPDAEWRAYAIPTGSDGKVTAYTNKPNQNYFVVRKGFEHPELLIKGKNVSLAYNQSSEAFTDTSETVKYYSETVTGQYGIDPLGGFDYYNAAQLAYQHITEALDGKRDEHDMSMYENSLYESCKRYKEAIDSDQQPATDDWLNYQCRVVSGKIVNDTQMNLVDPVFFDQTETMKMKWSTLIKMEEEAIMQIVTNQKDVDYFDEFVKDWMAAGGEQITKEVNEAIGK